MLETYCILRRKMRLGVEDVPRIERKVNRVAIALILGATAVALLRQEPITPKREHADQPPVLRVEAVYNGRADYIDAGHSRGVDCSEAKVARPKSSNQFQFDRTVNYANPPADFDYYGRQEPYYLVGSEGKGAGSTEGGYYNLEQGWQINYDRRRDRYLFFTFNTKKAEVATGYHEYPQSRTEEIPFVSNQFIGELSKKEFDPNEMVSLRNENTEFTLSKDSKGKLELIIECVPPPPDHNLI